MPEKKQRIRLGEESVTTSLRIDESSQSRPEIKQIGMLHIPKADIYLMSAFFGFESNLFKSEWQRRGVSTGSFCVYRINSGIYKVTSNQKHWKYDIFLPDRFEEISVLIKKGFIPTVFNEILEVYKRITNGMVEANRSRGNIAVGLVEADMEKISRYAVDLKKRVGTEVNNINYQTLLQRIDMGVVNLKMAAK